MANLNHFTNNTCFFLKNLLSSIAESQNTDCCCCFYFKNAGVVLMTANGVSEIDGRKGAENTDSIMVNCGLRASF